MELGTTISLIGLGITLLMLLKLMILDRVGIALREQGQASINREQDLVNKDIELRVTDHHKRLGESISRIARLEWEHDEEKGPRPPTQKR